MNEFNQPEKFPIGDKPLSPSENVLPDAPRMFDNPMGWKLEDMNSMESPIRFATREEQFIQNQETLPFSKIRDVKSPSRANPLDAGIDFFVPNDFKAQTIKPHEIVIIKSGIKANLPSGFMLMVANKSGVATKKKLITLACVDKDTLINTNKGLFSAEVLTKKFIKRNKIQIRGFNQKEGNFGYYNFDGFRSLGHKRCVKLRFNNNLELICSEDHMILTKDGWKQAISLNEGDVL